MNRADLPSISELAALVELDARGTCWTTRTVTHDGRINGNVAGRLVRRGWADRIWVGREGVVGPAGVVGAMSYLYRITDAGRAALAKVDR